MTTTTYSTRDGCTCSFITDTTTGVVRYVANPACPFVGTWEAHL